MALRYVPKLTPAKVVDEWPDEPAPVIETHFEGDPSTPLVQVIEHVGGELTMRYQTAEPRKPGRPPSGKVRVTMLLDPAVIAKFKATGDGWQARINNVLMAAKV